MRKLRLHIYSACHRVSNMEPEFHLIYLIGGVLGGWHEVTAGILAVVVGCHFVAPRGSAHPSEED